MVDLVRLVQWRRPFPSFVFVSPLVVSGLGGDSADVTGQEGVRGRNGEWTVRDSGFRWV